jgi:hypothetical protein
MVRIFSFFLTRFRRDLRKFCCVSLERDLGWVVESWILVDIAANIFLDDETADGTTVYDALEKGFDDLMDLCDVVTEKFMGARDHFASAQEV